MTERSPEEQAVFEAKYRPPIVLQASIDAVEGVLKAGNERWQRFPERYGVGISLRNWASGVDWLAGDYDYLLDADYNQLQMRRLGLENMMEAAEAMGLDDLLVWMVGLVDEIDEKFRKVTLLDTVGYSESDQRWVPSYWFLRRLPEDDAVLEAFRLRGPLASKGRTRRRAVTRFELKE